LGCPFGCREAHRKKASAKRSAAYYGDAQGKKRKSLINQRRSSKASAPRPLSVPAPKPRPVKWNPEIVEHVRVVVSLIEGRWVSRRQVLAMLGKNLRQHSMVRRRKIDQVVAWLNKEPP
jgi:hypothetical protein